MVNDPDSEADAFDKRVDERIQNGYIPDLRRAQFCEWFYNNPWRHPKYVDMVFGEYFRFALAHMPKIGAKVLELGSGTGHMSLELARKGFHVTGVDISAKSIEIAERVRNEISYLDSFGSLNYKCEDFLKWHTNERCDAVCLFLTLHHFDNIKDVLHKVVSILNPSGTIIVIEPARDWISVEDASIIALIRLLLASSQHWYEDISLPNSKEDLQRYIEVCLNEYRDAKDANEDAQSPHDNSSFASDMLKELDSRFQRIDYCPGYAFIPRMVGGVRASTEEQTLEIANFLKIIDEFLVDKNVLKPGAFYFAGRLDIK